ncbi:MULTISPECIES: hypothetical protein [Actinoalloteichus]|uniref:hypothetical protein n=1 Tax=Actinoalloteichus TaxID=65496 RepID=UPI0012F8A80F|nr:MULTISPECIES: hypothetical protein [Actinoalloteichus]
MTAASSAVVLDTADPQAVRTRPGCTRWTRNAEPTPQTDGGDGSEVIEVSVGDARHRLSELLAAVSDGEFGYLTSSGTADRGAHRPADVAEDYERVEDEYCARRAADVGRDPADLVPWEEAVAGLERRCPEAPDPERTSHSPTVDPPRPTAHRCSIHRPVGRLVPPLCWRASAQSASPHHQGYSFTG